MKYSLKDSYFEFADDDNDVDAFVCKHCGRTPLDRRCHRCGVRFGEHVNMHPHVTFNSDVFSCDGFVDPTLIQEVL